jgi:hypothetical protein
LRRVEKGKRRSWKNREQRNSGEEWHKEYTGVKVQWRVCEPLDASGFETADEEARKLTERMSAYTIPEVHHSTSIEGYSAARRREIRNRL